YVADPSDPDAKPDKLRYEPVFTLLDLMIDPGYYAARPLIHINYLPLRQEIIEAEFGDSEEVVRRYLKLGRVAPIMYVAHGGPIAERHAFDEPYRAAFARADRAIDLWSAAPGNLRLIAPASSDDMWRHVSEWPTEAPIRVAFADLGRAWRALDAAGANEAIGRIAELAPAINSELYPQGRAGLELAYNRANAFEWGMWAYVVSLATLLVAMSARRRWLVALGVTALFAAIAMHAVGFGLRCFIAERFAIQNQFESMTGLSLFAAVVGAMLMLARRQWLFGAAAAATGFLVLVTATQTGIPGKSIAREAAILNTSVLLKYHVTIVLVSYGLITIGFVTSLFYLATHYLTRPGDRLAMAVTTDIPVTEEPAASASSPTRARTLKDLDGATMTILQLAFWTLGVGILLGAWWADHSWGRWWAFDPKETWALITWIVYLVVIHVRFGARDKGLVTAWLSVVGFVVMLWTYFGVNLLLPGLHAYA
ncbi:MAG: cytochrome c biogenesis protein CcsA, partial [Planctomycetota bacterium]